MPLLVGGRAAYRRPITDWTSSQELRCTLSSKLESLPQVEHPVLGYPSRLLSRTEIAEGTMAFQFERPRNFLFKAGQFIDLTLPDASHDGSNGLTHTFSIASSSFDAKLVIATRMRDTAFKRALSILPLGAEVRIKGPMGSFTLHNNASRPAVFLAGGIGIVPFLSMLCSAAVDKVDHSIFLFYANRYFEDAAFMDDLWDLASSNRNFRFIPTFTRIDAGYRGWKGAIGHINQEMLCSQINHLRGPIFYIAGPPTMVAAARQTLIETGVDEDDIRTEEFGGY
jgi:ferredoxin-NADP reductase